ncbi:hypothetical protein H8959_001533 [Pygathrix nigripes]
MQSARYLGRRLHYQPGPRQARPEPVSPRPASRPAPPALPRPRPNATRRSPAPARAPEPAKAPPVGGRQGARHQGSPRCRTPDARPFLGTLRSLSARSSQCPRHSQVVLGVANREEWPSNHLFSLYPSSASACPQDR